VSRSIIPTIDYEGFDIVVFDGRTMPCTQNIPQLRIALGNYTVTNDFYLVEMPDTNIIFGAQ
jgi:hypothetical protein